MKVNKFLTTVALSSLLIAGALFVGQSAKGQEVKRAKATTDIGTITVSEVRNAISNATTLYLLPTQNYGLPDSWDYGYTGVGEEDGMFINGVKCAGGVLKYAGTGSAYITFYVGLPSAAVEGDLIEFKGTFSSAASGYSFTMDFATERFGETWVNDLEDYDVVSLADANMPDFSSGAAINTDDMGSDYNYVTDPAGLPKQKGFLGLTNNTGSYAFQFNYRKTATGTGWFHVLIGGQGPLWKTGHFIDFGFLDSWADTGHAQIKEMKGNGNNWAADELHATGAIALGWNVGETNLLEMGLIKSKGSSQYYVFFKVNGALKFGEYWTLDSEADGMTTKVTLQYAGTDATVSNSITPESTKVVSAGTWVSDSNQLYFNLEKDSCPAVNNWTDYFMSVDGTGLKLNGSAIGVSNWNYFKKTGSTQFFLALGDLGITPVAGDVLYVGGMFKTARTVNGVKVLFKTNFAATYFEFTGSSWMVFNPDYSIADFSIDLLKVTLPICSAKDDGNHDALASAWATLSGSSYYGKLTLDQKTALGAAIADPSVVVPSTAEEIEDMLPEEAVGAAMYRYDCCTGKYNLTNFISGRSISYNHSILILISKDMSNKLPQILAIVISATLIIGAAGSYFIFKKKKEK